MADTKISDLTSGNPAQSGDELPVARSGSNVKVTAGSIAALAAVTDGDKGDITVSGSGATWTVDAGAIGTAKLGGDITTAGKALLDDVDAAAQRTTLGLGTAATSNTGDFAAASHNHAASAITSGTVDTARLGSGTASNTTYLRGDQTWAAVPATTAGGSDTQVQFNDGGTSFGGDSGLTYNKTSDTLSTKIVALGTAGSALGQVTLAGNTSGVVTVQPAAAAGTWSLTLPTTAGSNGQALTTNGSGVASWSTIAATPGGSDTQLQYNSSGAFAGTSGITTTGTELTVASGTKTVSTPALNITQTWNGAGPFSAAKINVSVTGSEQGYLQEWQLGGSHRARIRWDGNFELSGSVTATAYTAASLSMGPGTAQFLVDSTNLIWLGYNGTNNYMLTLPANKAIGWSSSNTPIYTTSADLFMWRDGASGILAQRNGANAQVFRLYDTYASSTDYHRVAIKTARATLSSVSGATVTATSLIPDGAVVVGVTTKVTTGLGTGNGTTGYTVGDGTDADRWGAITGTAAGTSSDNRDWTDGTVTCFTAANNVVITATGGDFNGTGVIYVSVQYLTGECD